MISCLPDLRGGDRFVAFRERKGIPVGAAPKILEEAGLTPGQMWASEREWFLDTATGELKPEDDPRGNRPEPVWVARDTYD
jgi:hypothetical protein